MSLRFVVLSLTGAAALAVVLLARSGGSCHDAAADVMHALSAAEYRIATLQDSESESDALINNVIDAQFGVGDSTIWVLDEYGPHVRRFNLRGDLIGSFGRTGDGPLELRHPRSLAVKDSLIAVADQSGLSLFRPDGRAYRTHLGMPVVIEAVGVGCDGSWLVAGSRLKRATNTDRSGIYRVEISPLGPITAVPVSTDTSTQVNWLKTRRFAWHDTGFTAFDLRKGNGVYLRGRCVSGGLIPIAEAPAENRSVALMSSTGRLVQRVSVTRSTAVPTGFAVLDGALLSSYWTVADNLPGSRIILDEDGHVRKEVVLPGQYAIADASSGMLAFVHRDPASRILVVRGAPIMAALRAVQACARD